MKTKVVLEVDKIKPLLIHPRGKYTDILIA